MRARVQCRPMMRRRTESIRRRQVTMARRLVTRRAQSEADRRVEGRALPRACHSRQLGVGSPICAEEMAQPFLSTDLAGARGRAAERAPAAVTHRRPIGGTKTNLRESSPVRCIILRMTYHERIHRDPNICAGQPVIRGTRVLVRTILSYLAQGSTSVEIRAEFPSLSDEDIRAVIAFAAAAASEDLPAPSPIPPEVKVA